MKKLSGKILPAILICLVGIAAIAIGIVYFNFISERIYQDSTSQLEEIYGQVNRTFGMFVERNWGLLAGWEDYFKLMEDMDGEDVRKFIGGEKEYWGFSEFYFRTEDGGFMMSDGSDAEISIDSGEDMFERGGAVMAGGTLKSGQEITLFARKVEGGKYAGRSFDAIAVSYTNADLVNSLKVGAFSGKAKCFVIHDDGRVLLSTQAGGSVFGNYLVYLESASDMDAEALAALRDDIAGGRDGLLQCNIGGVSHCILYQPVGYQDLFLLSVVPQSAVSAGFLTIQKTTVNVLIVIFLLVSLSASAGIIAQNRRRTRRNRTELQYRERMFDVLSNTVDDIFFMLDAETKTIDYISPNLERLLGIKTEDARKNIKIMEKCAVDYNVVIPEEQLDSMPLNGTHSWECEYMHQTTGERRWYRMTLYHMSIQNVRKYIVVMSDRTQEQKMNKQLQSALNAAKSANEAKSNFLSNMSHDIRTPMNAIVGFSVLLEKDADNVEKVREYTHKIMASGHHLLSLINDVLDMSKIESGKTSLNVDRFSLPELLEELSIILMPQAHAKEQELTIHVHGTPPEQMLGDKLRLNQILINLLSNAVKYTPNGGKIEFSVHELSAPAPQYVKLQFVVKDNGIGMSEEFQKHVFAPFSREISSVTNKIQGTGLGMAITKNLVDLMGGIIAVESSPGMGSTFTVELSFALPEHDEADADAWYRHKITRMLVADDEEDVCLNIKEMMRDTGVDVAFVTDGLGAVDAAVRAHDNGMDFHVILLDWKMPGVNGVDTARMIRARIGENVPILVLTSYDWSEIETEARLAGINAFMPKPFFPSTFWQTIEPLFFEENDDGEQHGAEETMDVLRGKLFLVAEDNELNAEILTEVLDMEGAKCEIAVNGREAVEMFEASEPGRYDMIFMDVQMPVMNGYEATRTIRAGKHPEAKTIPIVAMTANTFAEDVRDALAAGMNGHLAKPIDMNAVRETVARLSGKTGDTTKISGDAAKKAGDD